MTEQEVATTSDGARVVCMFTVCAVSIGIVWATQHYNVDVPWKFDLSNVQVVAQQAEIGRAHV